MPDNLPPSGIRQFLPSSQVSVSASVLPQGGYQLVFLLQPCISQSSSISQVSASLPFPAKYQLVYHRQPGVRQSFTPSQVSVSLPLPASLPPPSGISESSTLARYLVSASVPHPARHQPVLHREAFIRLLSAVYQIIASLSLAEF
jgi:hypothetical protein